MQHCIIDNIAGSFQGWCYQCWLESSRNLERIQRATAVLWECMEYIFFMKSILKPNAKANNCMAILFPEKCSFNLVRSYSKCLLGKLLSKSWHWVSSLLCSSSFCTLAIILCYNTHNCSLSVPEFTLSKSKECLYPIKVRKTWKDNTFCTFTHKFCRRCSPDSEERFVFKPFCLL